jgi:hypothetical protein
MKRCTSKFLFGMVLTLAIVMSRNPVCCSFLDSRFHGNDIFTQDS